MPFLDCCIYCKLLTTDLPVVGKILFTVVEFMVLIFLQLMALELNYVIFVYIINTFHIVMRSANKNCELKSYKIGYFVASFVTIYF